MKDKASRLQGFKAWSPTPEPPAANPCKPVGVTRSDAVGICENPWTLQALQASPAAEACCKTFPAKDTALSVEHWHDWHGPTYFKLREISKNSWQQTTAAFLFCHITRAPFAPAQFNILFWLCCMHTGILFMTVHLSVIPWVSPETSNAVAPRQIKIKMPLGASSFKGSLQMLNTQSDASPSWQGPGPIRTETACSTKAIPSFGAIVSAILYNFTLLPTESFARDNKSTFAPVLQGAISPRVSAQCLKDTRAQTKPRYASKESARTVGAKGRVFPEALTQSALAGVGGALFLQVTCMVRS